MWVFGITALSQDLPVTQMEIKLVINNFKGKSTSPLRAARWRIKRSSQLWKLAMHPGNLASQAACNRLFHFYALSTALEYKCSAPGVF
jgi:hypothetical protein